MDETLAQILTYVQAIWQRRWLVLAVTVIVCAIGWPVVIAMPDNYRVSARLQLDTQSILKPLLSGIAVDNRLTQQTALVLQRTLLTYPNLERIARATDMDLQVKKAQEFDDLIKGLQNKIQITKVRIRAPDNMQARMDDVYAISYEHSDPKLAKRVVDEMLTLFIEKALGVTRKDTKLTQQFLTEQIEEYEEKLVEAEQRLKNFKRENVGMMPREGENFYARLSNEENQLKEAQLALDEALKRRDEIKKQINGVLKSVASGEGNQSLSNMSPLETRIQALEENLDELLLQFTDEHPDVVSTRRMLDVLKQQKETEKESQTEGDEARLLENNPVYQDLKLRLGDQEAEVAALQVRIKLFQSNVKELNDRIDTMPEIEAELTNLNRDYSVIRTNYEELVKRRESAKISFDAETKGDDINFKVIEPPRMPLAPVWPNRPLLETAVLVMGLGMGAGLAILLMMIRSTFSTPASLKDKLGFPVFGVVSMVKHSREITKERIYLALFGIASFMLIAVYGAIVASQVLNLNLIAM